MAPTRIFILGHSFIRRLHVFLRQNFNEVFARNLHIDGDLSIKWEREQTAKWEIVSHNNFIFIDKFILFWKQCPFEILMRK